MFLIIRLNNCLVIGTRKYGSGNADDLNTVVWSLIYIVSSLIFVSTHGVITSGFGLTLTAFACFS